MEKLNLIFCGTPDFSLPVLDLLRNHPLINLVSTITMPDRKSGRGQHLTPPPVASYCKDHHIPCFQTDNINNEDQFLKKLKNQKIDLIIVLAFAQFLSDQILNLPQIGCFNIHTSLLPKYRGAAPIQHAIINGDKETGVSIQKMVSQMDAGDIVLSDITPIYEFETGGMLYTRLKFKAAEALSDFLFLVKKNKLIYRPQSEDNATFAPSLKKNDGLIDFKKKRYQEINNQVRAFDPWPGTFCFLDTNKRLKIFKVEPFKNHPLASGQIDISLGLLLVGTKDVTLRITEVQLEGKKKTSDKEFINGLQSDSIAIKEI